MNLKQRGAQMGKRPKRFLLLGATLALFGVGFAPFAGAAAAHKTIPAPKGLPAFYSVPQPIPATPGTILKTQKMPAAGVHGTLYRVMYV
jgi:hypothetical protein